jgi:hypothetical protein
MLETVDDSVARRHMSLLTASRAFRSLLIHFDFSTIIDWTIYD